MDKLNFSLDELASKEKPKTVFSRLGAKPAAGNLFNMMKPGHGGKNGGKGKGGGKAGKGGKGGAGGKKSHVVVRTEEDGSTVHRLFDTDVVRITATDIILNSGGFRTRQTLEAMNAALSPYTFRVAIADNDEWHVSDGKYRLVRLIDGIAITGAATELRADAAPSVAAGGPVRVARLGGGAFAGAARFRPY